MRETGEDGPIRELDGQSAWGAIFSAGGALGIASPYFSEYLMQNPGEVPKVEAMAVVLLGFGLHKMGVNSEMIGGLALSAKERVVNVTEPAIRGLHNLYTNVGARVSSAGARISSIPLFQPRQRLEEVYQTVQHDEAA